MQLESERLTVLECEIVYVWLRSDFQVLLFDYFLVCVTNQRFESFLSDLVSEFLTHHSRGRFAGAKSGESYGRCISAGRLVFSFADRFNWNRYLNMAVDSGAVFFCYFNRHAEEYNGMLYVAYRRRTIAIESPTNKLSKSPVG